MHKTLKILSVILFFTTCLFAEDYLENKEVGDVKVTIENPIDTYNTSSIINRLSTQKNKAFSQSIFDNDLKKLAEDFDKVDPNIEVKNDNKIYITIKLWLRPTIIKINWRGNKEFSAKKLQKEFGLNPPVIYDKVKFNSALNKVKEMYIKKGYFESQITYQENFYPDKNEVSITIFVKEGKSGKIKSIEFEGFTPSEKSDLLNEIITKKYNILTSWVTGAGIFREDVLEQDKMSIINYLQNKGYSDAKIDINISEDPDSKKIIIEIVAHRGTLYRFGKITFDGNCLLTNDEIIKRFLIHPEEPFSPEQIRQTTQAIKDAYGEKGYIEANVYYDIHLQEHDPIYNVNFYIDEGDCYKIGYIKISGNTSTQARVILRHSLLVPGQTFDSRKLKSTQKKLEAMGYFKNVNVYAVQSCDPNLGPNYKDVHIEVEEASTGHFSFASNFSASENVSGTIDVSENNFDLGGITKIFSYGPSALRGGGEYAQLKGTLGRRQKNASATWVTPYFKDSLWKLGCEFSATSSRLQSKNYKIKTIGGSIYSSYPINTFLSAGMKYRLRNSDNEIKANVRDKQKAKKDKEKEENNDGLISSIGSFLSYDSTDNSYKPQTGYRSLLQAEYVGLGGDFKFFKFGYNNSYYYPVWLKGTLKYRFDFNFMKTIHDLKPKSVPLSERYFLGGETTVRGYKPYIIGPHLDNDKKDPRGGVSSALLSIEYNQVIIKPLVDIFLFVDAGAIAYEEFKIKKFRTSFGIGTRLEIMNRVPVTVGWGCPVNPKNHSDRQHVFFYMGGQF